jgi:CheY-like chemotaxis protein
MNKKILVVEEDQSIQRYLKELLSDNGYSVVTSISDKALDILSVHLEN